MTYIDLINYFWDSATTNPLSTGQVSLYFALLHVCNRSYWTEWFSAPNQVLSVLTGLSRSGILKARNELKQRGLIDFRERGTKATSYRLVMPESKQTNVLIANSKQVGAQDGVQNGKQNSVQNGVQNSSTLYKTKDKRQDEDKRKPPVSPVQRFEEFWEAYPNKQRRYLTESAYCELIRSGRVREEELVEAAGNYAAFCEERKADKTHMKNADNFLKEFVFEDYLHGKSKTEERKSTGGIPEENEELVGEDWINCDTFDWNREGVWD